MEPYFLIDATEIETTGGNVMASWNQYLSDGGEIEIQFYYDRASRDEELYLENSDTLDLEFKHQFTYGKKQDIIWGLHYRYIYQQFTNSFWNKLDPENADTNLFSLFAQDEYTALKDKLIFTLGSKFEHNDYTGYEIQPSARALYSPLKNHKFWGAVSRAVRTPHRIERDAKITTVVLPPLEGDNPLPVPAAGGIVGNDNYDSQIVVAYEVGYRFLASKSLSFDLALFYNDYNDLRSFKINPSFNGSYGEVYNKFGNEADGTSHGLELAVAWQLFESLKLDLAYSFIKEDYADINITWDGESPRNQFSLRANWNITESLSFDLWGRYVDNSASM
ncbi:MAG: TonB-dependent receptor [Desulfobulbaceae bacterium]|nr:TonB-dependent receptor [Desulfobulbaceae bacterium]